MILLNLLAFALCAGAALHDTIEKKPVMAGANLSLSLINFAVLMNKNWEF